MVLKVYQKKITFHKPANSYVEHNDGTDDELGQNKTLARNIQSFSKYYGISYKR